MNTFWAEFLEAHPRNLDVATAHIKLHDALPHYGILRISGEDATAFLHGQFTCDVQGLDAQRWTWGAYCSAKGRVITNFILWKHATQYRLLLPEPLTASMAKRLRMFVLRSRVSIEDESERLVVMGISGEGARSALGTIGVAVDDQTASVLSCGEDAQVLLLSAQRTLVVGACEAASTCWTVMQGSTRAATAGEWNRTWIEQGEPWITLPTQELYVPQMLNLELLGGVSFTKGCYPGQEIVARSQHLGQVKRRLYRYRVITREAIDDGAAIFAEDHAQSVGAVVNAERVNESETHLLAVMQTQRHGAPVHLRSPEGPLLESLPLPYVIP